MAARGKTSGGEQRQREHAETAAGPRRIDVSFPFQPISVIREGAFTLFGGLDDPVAECDGGFIGTELVEVTAPDEAGARAALRIKGKALDDKYREKYKCEKEYCERAGAKCVFRAGWAGQPTFEPQPDITLDDDGANPQIVKGQVVGKWRRHFGCFCRVLV